jgi:hypothetical protein
MRTQLTTDLRQQAIRAFAAMVGLVCFADVAAACIVPITCAPSAMRIAWVKPIWSQLQTDFVFKPTFAGLLIFAFGIVAAWHSRGRWWVLPAALAAIAAILAGVVEPRATFSTITPCDCPKSLIILNPHAIVVVVLFCLAAIYCAHEGIRSALTRALSAFQKGRKGEHDREAKSRELCVRDCLFDVAALSGHRTSVLQSPVRKDA